MKKKEKFYTEEQKEIYSFIKILICLVVIVILFYFLTSHVFNNKSLYKRTNNKGSVQYNYIYLGSLLNEADNEYYVLAVDSTKSSYTNVLNKSSVYRSKETGIPLYYSDLSLEFNKDFVAKESSYDPTDVTKLKINGIALIKVKDKKITKFITNTDEILSLLK